MEVIPSIDLRSGKVVLLTQGDYARQTTFSDDPVAVARGFEEAGAPRLHVVDLDGARSGSPAHIAASRDIAAAVSIPVELGGGMRNAEAVQAALAAGIDRVVVGTAAVQDAELVRELVATHGPERIAVGLDARDGLIAVSGWTVATDVKAADLMADMARAGICRFIYTDIWRGSTLTAPNFDAVSGIVQRGRELSGDVRIIASGGVASLDHLRRLAALGVEGAIVGSALYRGTLDLAEAVAELGRE